MRLQLVFVLSVLGAAIATPIPVDDGASVARDTPGNAGKDWRRIVGAPEWRRNVPHDSKDWRRTAENQPIPQ